jgi:hypothetical protein
MSESAFLAANRQVLTATHPVIDLPLDSSQVRHIDGTWRLVEEDRAVALHSREPHKEADAQIAGLFAAGRNPEFVVTIGLGVGFLLDALDRRGWTGKVLALEPVPAATHHLLARRDLREWLRTGRLRILLGPEYPGATDCFSLFGDGATVPPVFVNPTLARVRPGDVERARALVKRLCHETRANAEARRELGGRYLLNTLGNLTAIATGGDVGALFGAAERTPTILVAAGPSLERALPMLREVQQSALVVCVDTALRPLLAAGVEPHLVVAVDPSEHNAHHLTDLPPCPNTYLVAEGSLDALALDAFGGRTFFFNVGDHHPWPWLNKHGGHVGRLSAWGSVLTTAFDLTLRMGCDPVVFAGADLAYTGGQTYSRGVFFEEQWRRQQDWGTPIPHQWAGAIERQPHTVEPDLAGGEARTAPHLLAFRNWILEQIQRHPARRFFNASGSGILYGAGITLLTHDEVAPLVAGTSIPPETLATLIETRHQPRDASAVVAAGHEVLAGLTASNDVANDVVTAWQAFAGGITPTGVTTSLRAALVPSSAGTPSDDDRRPRRARPHQNEVRQLWLQPFIDAVPLVPFVIPPHRLTTAPSGARVFRYRTQAARIISCVVQLAVDGFTEDGRPLALALDLDHVVAGTYSITRDECHFRASDGSDPRTNGRRYVLFVPPCVAALEQLPLHEVLHLQL